MLRCGHVSKIWILNWDFDSEYAARWQMRSILTLCCPRSPQMRSSVRHRHGLGYTCGIDSDGSWIAMFPHWTRTGSGKTAPTNSRLYSPAVSPAGETTVAVLLVDARWEQEARVGEDLKERKIVKKGESQGRSEHLCSGTVPREVCAAGLVFAHRVAILHNPQSHKILNNTQSQVQNPAQSRHNHVLTTGSNQIGKIMTPVWVAVGLRWIWWFLVCNLWLVSRLYLQPDMSACQSSCLSCPQFQKSDESFSHPDVHPQTFPVPLQMLRLKHPDRILWEARAQFIRLDRKHLHPNICIWWKTSKCAASGENAILHCKAVNLKLTPILKWLKIFFLTYIIKLPYF